MISHGLEKRVTALTRNRLPNAYLEGKGGVSMGDLAAQNTVHVREDHGYDAFPGNGINIVPVSQEVIEVRAE